MVSNGRGIAGNRCLLFVLKCVCDADALKASKHVISGEISCGYQYHFYMETQVSVCLSVCLSACLSACLSVCLSVCLITICWFRILIALFDGPD